MKCPFLIIYLFPLALWAQAPAGITFPVETLTPHKGPLPQMPLPAGDTFYRPGLDSLVCGSEGMGLYQTVKMAFSGHYPLVLSPDLIWSMIARGIAQHIQANPDSLRALVVDHAGPEKVQLTRVAVGSRKRTLTQDWQNEIHAYRALVRAHGLKPGFDRLMSPAFSTTTPFEATAHDIGTLASVKDFFVFRTSIIFCGIPSVTLEGRPRDWRDLRRRCERLSDYGLGWWEDDLLPVLDQFVAASRGQADTTFWQGLYRMPVKDPSGKKIIRHCGYSPNGTSGWVTVFYPYLKRQPNPRLHDNDPSAYIKEDDLLTSQVTFTLTLEYREALPVFTETWSIWTGIAGVSQHPVTRALRPEICWGVVQQPGENRLTLNPLDTMLRATGMSWLGLWDVSAAVPGLVALHADSNNFRSLPQELIAMPRLDSLFASHNHLREGGYYLPFSEIPARRYWPGAVEPDGTLSEPHLAFTEAGYEMKGPTPTSLRYADLSHNELDSDFLASLALWQPRHTDTLRVDLRHNAIETLPAQLWNIQYPIILNLTGNPLEAVWPLVKPLPSHVRVVWQPAVAAPAPTPCIWPALDECPIDDAYDTRVPAPADEILEEED